MYCAKSATSTKNLSVHYHDSNNEVAIGLAVRRLGLGEGLGLNWTKVRL